MSLTTYIIIMAVLAVPTIIGFWKGCDEITKITRETFGKWFRGDDGLF